MSNTAAEHSFTYRPDIDGLRAIAVLPVVFYHAFPSLLPGGYVGVDIFFVISGYLITNIILQSINANQFNVSQFYARRIRRIFPALIVVLFVSLLLGWNLLVPGEFRELGKHVIAGAGFSSNLVLWAEAGYFDMASSEKPLLHLWSLGVEEQFYIFWPLTLLFLSRLKTSISKGILLISMLSFSACIIATYTSPVGAFYGPMFRAWELGVGGLLASTRYPNQIRLPWGLSRDNFSWVGFSLIAVAVLFFEPTSKFPGWRALFPVIGSALLILAGPKAIFNSRILSAKPMIWIGLISYPLYLWHWVILTFGRIHLSDKISTESILILVGISFAMAAGTYYLIEKPVRFAPITRKQLATITGLMGITAIGGASVLAFNGYHNRYPIDVADLLTPYDFKSDARHGECWFSKDEPPETFETDCRPIAGDKPNLLIWGDSHAARLAVGMRIVFDNEYSVSSLARSSCPPFINETGGLCKRSNEYILNIIKQKKPESVVIFGAWSFYLDYGYSDARIFRGLKDILDRLEALDVKQVILIGTSPQWNGSLPRILHDSLAGTHSSQQVPMRLRRSLKSQAFELDQKMRTEDWGANVTYFSLIGALCNINGCLARVPTAADQLTTYDYGHLTTAGAIYISQDLSRIMN